MKYFIIYANKAFKRFNYKDFILSYFTKIYIKIKKSMTFSSQLYIFRI